MPFTEEDMLEQQKALAEIKDEFARVSAQFEAMMQQVGLTSETLLQEDDEPMTPELQAMVDKAQEEARRAGAARAAQYEARTAKRAPVAGRGRAGIIRL